MNISYQSFIQFLIGENFKIVIVVVSFIVAIGTIFYIRNKAKSGFSILNFLWVFVFQQKTKEGDLINDIIEIEKFNFFYNTYATSKKEKLLFESWVKKYELNFRYIAKLKTHFKIETLKVKKIKKKTIAFMLIFMFSPIVFLFPTLNVAIKPAGLIQLYDSGWFWFNEKEAKEYNMWTNHNNAWIITEKECKNEKNNLLNNAQLKEKLGEKSIEVINIICESFSDEDSLKYISKLIKKQRWFFGIVSILLVAMFYALFRIFISLLFTYDVRRMIYFKIKQYRKRR